MITAATRGLRAVKAIMTSPAVAFLVFSTLVLRAAEPSPSAQELAGGLRGKLEGSTLIRARMETAGNVPEVIQLQIKSRVSPDRDNLVYQILFPKEHKGEGVLLTLSSGQLSGVQFAPPGDLQPVKSFQAPLFGSALSFEDIIDDVYKWKDQKEAGRETIDGIDCAILESTPDKSSSSYSRVRTWIDPRRLVPLRIEKYGKDGKLLRRMEITRILLDGSDSLPVNMTVTGPGGKVTKFDGSRIKRRAAIPDAAFTPEGLKELSAPREPETN